jgi:HD-like signal output (HDOD) protein
VLTAKVLRMAALGGAEISRAQIGVAQLVTRLGLHQVRSILIPEALRGLFFSSPESFWKECWEHSILCAQLCRLIASWVQYPLVSRVPRVTTCLTP